MRVFRNITLVTFFFLAFASKAMTWNEEILKQQIDSLNHLQYYIADIEQVEDIDAALNHLDQQQKIVLQFLWLNELTSQERLSNVQQEWVKTLTERGLSLKGSLHDHPNSMVSLIDLQAQSKSVLRLINIKQQAHLFAKAWVQNSIDWTMWLQAESNEYHGFINWLKKQSANELAELAALLRQQQLVSKLPDNQPLLIILNHIAAVDIAQALLERETDSFTYQFIQQLPSMPLQHDGVQLLEKAIKKPELSSLSIIVLAKHYDAQKSAQTILLEALDNEAHQWHVMVALEKVTDHGFVTLLTQRLASKPSKFSRAALKQMAKGARL